MQRASVMGMPSPEPSGSYSQQFKAMRFSYHIEGGAAATSPQIRTGKCDYRGGGEEDPNTYFAGPDLVTYVKSFLHISMWGGGGGGEGRFQVSVSTSGKRRCAPNDSSTEKRAYLAGSAHT